MNYFTNGAPYSRAGPPAFDVPVSISTRATDKGLSLSLSLWSALVNKHRRGESVSVALATAVRGAGDRDNLKTMRASGTLARTPLVTTVTVTDVS